MANQLDMATIDDILALRRQRWSIRRIARTLGIHRDTVARHLQQAKQAGAPTGSAEVSLGQAPPGSPEVNLGQAPPGSTEATQGKVSNGPSPAAKSRRP